MSLDQPQVIPTFNSQSGIHLQCLGAPFIFIARWQEVKMI